MADSSASGESSPRESAAFYMVTQVPRAFMETPVSEVLESLRGQKFDCADTLFVTDREGRLEGIVRIDKLFAGGQEKVGDIMQREHKAVRYEDDQEKIAVLAMEVDMISVPVVDDEDRLIGAVPPEALFEILRAEHMEDLQRLAGIAPHEEGPMVSLDAPLRNRFSRRLPWLIFGLLASSVITFVMVEFEHTLSANVTVAFFVPALVYIAGAIGTQAVSVSVRGLSTHDVSIGALLRDELVIGLAIGGVLGALSLFLVLIVFANGALALAVGLSVLVGGAVSAVIGFGLPWVFQRLGSDPALGSGPICTIVQDAGSLFIYFLLASVLVF